MSGKSILILMLERSFGLDLIWHVNGIELFSVRFSFAYQYRKTPTISLFLFIFIYVRYIEAKF